MGTSGAETMTISCCGQMIAKVFDSTREGQAAGCMEHVLERGPLPDRNQEYFDLVWFLQGIVGRK